jgi:hypothetical protein
MHGTREERDADRIENYVKYCDHETDLNRNEIFCATCAKRFYADDAAFEQFSRAVENDLDNPFVCDDCLEENNESAYAER